MKFPPDYPYSPPSIRFMTKVWHPNVYEVSKYRNYRSCACFFSSPSVWLGCFFPSFSPFSRLNLSPAVNHPLSFSPISSLSLTLHVVTLASLLEGLAKSAIRGIASFRWKIQRLQVLDIFSLRISSGRNFDSRLYYRHRQDRSSCHRTFFSPSIRDRRYRISLL